MQTESEDDVDERIKVYDVWQMAEWCRLRGPARSARKSDFIRHYISMPIDLYNEI